MSDRTYFVYMLTSRRNGALYIGVTNDLSRRIQEHKRGLIAGFTKQFHTDKLVWYEEFQYVNEALEREKQLKHWKREWKLKLIESVNVNWEDLTGFFI
jgi:putative endonuclease